MRESGEKTTADRLIIISDVEYMRLDAPVLIHPGETYWFDWASSALIVEGQDGQARSIPASWNGRVR